VLGRDGCPSGQTVVKEAAVSTRGRLLHATTDWRLLCRPISSIPAVRQLSAGKSVSAATLRLARQGGRKVENFESNGCARRACKLCGEAHWGGDLCAQEKVRERAGVAEGGRARRISRPVYSKCTGEHTGQKETALWARWGAHRERVEADA